MYALIRIFKLARNYWHYLAISTGSLIILTILNFATPALVRGLTSRLENKTLTENTIWILAGALFLAYFLRFIFNYLSSYISHKASWSLVPEIYWRLYDHLQKLSLRFYADRQTGELMSRIINDSDKVETLISHALPDIFSSMLTVIIVIFVLFSVNAKLALLTLIPIPFIFIASIITVKRVASVFLEAQKAMGMLSAVLQDNLSGIKEIQAFGSQADESERISALTKQYGKMQVHALQQMNFLRPLIQFFVSLGTVIALGYGGTMAMRGEISISDIVAFVLYLSLFYEPIAAMARTFEDFTRAYSGAMRIFEILDSEPDITDEPNAYDLTDCRGAVCFDNVTFHYKNQKDESQQDVLKNISFSVEPGKMLALVGPTGVGKTTAISLLERFYDPCAGTIRIDGHDIREVKLQSLRQNISLVLQDVFLFHGTIAENIGYGCKGATREKIIAAAKTACAHEFISDTPEGYDTMVGERGIRLSGGQKQRIAIARAVLRDTPILILDEATSSVDVRTEIDIQNAIQSLTGTCTIIVIAHRLSTVKAADQIVVLDQGEIAERGTHETLAAQNGIYSSYCLAQMQAIDQITQELRNE